MQITGKDILAFNFYTYKQPFTGSCAGMRYRIVMVKHDPEEGSGAEPEKKFFASVWREPYAYDVTPKEEIENREFPFDVDGYEQVIGWLNEKLAEYQGEQDKGEQD